MKKYYEERNLKFVINYIHKAHLRSEQLWFWS